MKKDSEDFSIYDEGVAVCIYGCLGAVVAVVSLLLLCFFTVGCTPKTVERVVVKNDTCYVDKVRRDSIHIHDSIFVHEYQRHDTLVIERVNWRTAWRERVTHDSIYIAHRDTLVRTIREEVAAPPTRWQRTMITLGTAVTLLLVAFIVYRLYLFSRNFL